MQKKGITLSVKEESTFAKVRYFEDTINALDVTAWIIWRHCRFEDMVNTASLISRLEIYIACRPLQKLIVGGWDGSG